MTYCVVDVLGRVRTDARDLFSCSGFHAVLSGSFIFRDMRLPLSAVVVSRTPVDNDEGKPLAFLRHAVTLCRRTT
jgi:hypothetical protein